MFQQVIGFSKVSTLRSPPCTRISLLRSYARRPRAVVYYRQFSVGRKAQNYFEYRNTLIHYLCRPGHRVQRKAPKR